MPKGFTDKEKQMIQQQLVDHAKMLFGQYGLKKTSIQDLTKAAGIAQGTFYLFYSSKEELFFEILELEEAEMKKLLLQESLAADIGPKLALRNLLLKSFDMVESNSILKQLLHADEMETLLRKLPQERLEAHLRKDFSLLEPIIQHWQKEGWIVESDAEVTGGVLRSIFLCSLHRKQIGESVYRETIDFLIDAVADKLTGGKEG